MDLYNIAVVGATGAVGRVFLDVLASRSFPLGELRLCASERSLGKEISFADRSLKIELATPEVFRDVHFVFISADSEVSRGLTPLYPHQIAFNALPHIEYFLENGYTNEEIKMLNETRKILHDDELPVSATCVRIPVMLSHSEAIHIEFDRKVTPSEVKEVLNQFDGVTVVDDPTDNVYPMPVDASGRDEVFVGRIREDVSHPNGIVMWVVTDNLRKGAATNAIQIAEEMIRRNLVTI